MASWSSGLSALRSRTGVRRVLGAYAAFTLLEFYTWLVVILWAYAAGGTPLAGAAALTQLLPAAIIAPFIAGFGDRLPRGTALVVAYLLVLSGAALTWALLHTGAATWAVLVGATWLTTTIAAARPVHLAALPELTRAEPAQLVSATSLTSVLDGVTSFAGPVLAGLVVAVSGAATAMAISWGMAALAVLLCVGLGLPRATHADGEEAPRETTLLREAVAGLAVLRGNPAALMLLLVMSLGFVLAGTLDVLGVAYADVSLGAGDAAAGLVVGSLGIGELVGAAIAGALAQRRTLMIVIVGGSLVEGLLFASTALFHRLVPVMLVLAASGVGVAVAVVAGRTLLQRTTDDRVLARVFAIQESVSLLGLALGAALAPVLARSVGVSAAWLPLGLAISALALLGILPLRRLDASSHYHPDELHLLRSVPFIGALPPYGLERLSQSAQWQRVSAGEVLLNSGDEGHEMYLVAEGELSVWVGGRRRPGVLGPGRWVGEVALLTGSRRTATVIVETPGRVLVVTRAAFIRAAGGDDHAELARSASDLYPDLRS